MNEHEARELLLRRSNAFHDRYFKAYGQMILRVDENTYMMSDENLTLSNLREQDFRLYDIGTGDIGAILSARKDINAIVFACTETSALFSADAELMIPALDDLAQIIGGTFASPRAATSKPSFPHSRAATVASSKAPAFWA